MLSDMPGISEEEKRRPLHCVVVGGGLTGVEFSGELSDFIIKDVHQRYSHVKDYIHVTLIEANEILSSFDDRLRKYASTQLTKECNDLGFDTIKLNAGSFGVPEDTLLRFVRLIKSAGLRAKPQFGVKFNKADIPLGDPAFGTYVPPKPQTSEVVEDVDLLIRRAERCLEAGADMI